MYKVKSGALHNKDVLYKFSCKGTLTYEIPNISSWYNKCCHNKNVIVNILIESIFKYTLQIICQKCGNYLVQTNYMGPVHMKHAIIQRLEQELLHVHS